MIAGTEFIKRIPYASALVTVEVRFVEVVKNNGLSCFPVEYRHHVVTESVAHRIDAARIRKVDVQYRLLVRHASRHKVLVVEKKADLRPLAVRQHVLRIS